MRERRELLVFVATVLVVGALVASDVASGYVPARVPATATRAAAELPRPARVRRPSEAAAVAPGPSVDRRDRGLFEPPRELLPMDPLAYPDPPLPRLPVRVPVVTPAPLVAAARDDRLPAAALGRLSLTGEDAPDVEERAGGYGFGGASPSGAGGNPSEVAAPRATGAARDDEPAAAPEDLYDWIVRASATRRHFGRILVDDPHGLADRPGEDVRFQDVSLRTGSTIGTPYVVPREDVLEFGLARTFANGYRAASRELGTGSGSVRGRMDLARELLAAADREPRALEFADEEATRALEAGRTDPAAARLLARVRALRHDPEGELSVYRRAVDEGWADDALLCDYGRFALRLGLVERAEALLAEARRLRPVSAEVRTLAGLLHLERGRPEEAVAAFRAADQVPHEPPFEEAARTELALLTGRAELAAGRADEALRAARRVLAGDPDDVAALHLQGAALAAAGTWDAAADSLAAALVHAPSDAELLADAGVVAWRRGDGPGAVRFLEAAVDRAPAAAARPMTALGFLHEAAADPERARELYAGALRVAPDDPDALYRLGRNQRREGDAEAADASLRRALRLAGPEPLLLAELGRAALDRGEPTLASRYLREGLRLEPDEPVLLWSLGLAHLAEGDLAGAVDVLGRAAAAGATGAHAGLGTAHARRGDDEAALDHFDEAVRAAAGEPDSPHARYAAEQAAALRDNLAKRQWVDRFGRSSLQRGWTEHQWDGSPRVTLRDDAVRVVGRVERPREDELPGIARVVDGRGFVSVEAALSAAGEGDGRFGLALTYRQVKGQRGRLPKARLELAVDAEGQVRLTALDNFETLLRDAWPVPGAVVPRGERVRLGVERVDAASGTFRFRVDGRPVGEPVELKSLRGFRNLLDLEVWGDAPPGRSVDVAIDEVRIVRFP